LRGLAALGLELPADLDDEAIEQAKREVSQLLGDRPVRDLLHNKPATDARIAVRSVPFRYLPFAHVSPRWPYRRQI
jgi:hypothetical protein